MDLWLVLVIYLIGVGLVVVESMTPGLVLGLLGLALIVVSAVFGFRINAWLGIAQVAGVVLLGPLLFQLGLRRLSLKTNLAESAAFSGNGEALVGQEGVAETDLRPSGIATLAGRRRDVITAGESVEKGRRVRVVRAEGIRLVVRAI